jgi:hypothetical protein
MWYVGFDMIDNKTHILTSEDHIKFIKLSVVNYKL